MFGTAMAIANAGRVGLNMAFGTTRKNAEAIASSKRKIAEMDYKYNMEQVENWYNQGYTNLMVDLVDKRFGQTQELDKAQSQLNMFLSQNDANSGDSSYEDDMNNQLEMEFTNNVQNLYANWVNQSSSLMANKVSQELQLSNNLITQKSAIDSTVNKVNEQMMNKLIGSVGQAGMSVMDDYGAFKKKGGKDASIASFFTTFGTGGDK